VIENRPGAGAIIGTDEAAKAAPDGYTLLMMSNTHTTNETLIAKKTYQLMRDFVPVAPINSSDLLMVIHPDVPAKTWRSSSHWQSPNLAGLTTRRRAQGRLTTWLASSSKL
jgi:tripartite-type tricarboxylate transporter receptor subunit TctC